jgi:hypothetical protein
VPASWHESCGRHSPVPGMRVSGDTMKILVFFRVTEAGRSWYVWPSASTQIYSFESSGEAQHFADCLTQANRGAECLFLQRSIEEAATLI